MLNSTFSYVHKAPRYAYETLTKQEFPKSSAGYLLSLAAVPISLAAIPVTIVADMIIGIVEAGYHLYKKEYSEAAHILFKKLIFFPIQQLAFAAPALILACAVTALVIKFGWLYPVLKFALPAVAVLLSPLLYAAGHKIVSHLPDLLSNEFDIFETMPFNQLEKIWEKERGLVEAINPTLIGRKPKTEAVLAATAKHIYSIEKDDILNFTKIESTLTDPGEEPIAKFDHLFRKLMIFELLNLRSQYANKLANILSICSTNHDQKMKTNEIDSIRLALSRMRPSDKQTCRNLFLRLETSDKPSPHLKKLNTLFSYCSQSSDFNTALIPFVRDLG